MQAMKPQDKQAPKKGFLKKLMERLDKKLEEQAFKNPCLCNRETSGRRSCCNKR
jgi:hypothetical protein